MDTNATDSGLVNISHSKSNNDMDILSIKINNIMSFDIWNNKIQMRKELLIKMTELHKFWEESEKWYILNTYKKLACCNFISYCVCFFKSVGGGGGGVGVSGRWTPLKNNCREIKL